MKEKSMRITVDIPAPLYRKLKERAAAKGCWVRELILAGIKTVLVEGQSPRPRKVLFPLIISKGAQVDVSD
jgi:hypothetical protein